MNRRPRLYIKETICSGDKINLLASHLHYLLHVLRLQNGDEILVFNEKEGEFLASLEVIKKQLAYAKVQENLRVVTETRNLLFCFAPIKKFRLDYMIQKVVELGVSAIQPVKTEYTQDSKLHYGKLELNIVEAMEQCGRLTKPKLAKICSLKDLLNNLAGEYHLFFCNEKEVNSVNSVEKIQKIKKQYKNLAVIIGPEGGFSPAEIELLLASRFVSSISLGENILRADTAAVAALALIELC